MSTLVQQSEKEKDKKRKALSLGLSIGIHLLIVLLLSYLIAWSPPDPPIPEYGIELAFGFTAEGSGDARSLSRPTPDGGLEAARPAPVTTPQPTAAAPTPTPAQPQQVQAVEATSTQSVEATTTPRPAEPVRNPAPTENVSRPAPTPTPTPTPTTQQTTGSVSDQGTSDRAQQSNSGDTPGTVGQAGSLTGDVGATLEGYSGSGGASLDMPGWKWDAPPAPNENSRDTGKIVFDITINGSGDVVNVQIAFRSVPRHVAMAYQEAIQNTTFSPVSGASRGNQLTRGRVTFIITAQ